MPATSITHTLFTAQLGLRIPVVQAPMGGGPSTVELAVAAADAGALGSLAGGYLPARVLREHLVALHEATDQPFNVNIFAEPKPDAADDLVEAVCRILSPYRQALGLSEQIDLAPDAVSFSEQIDVLVEQPPAVVSFTFGLPMADVIARLRAAGCLLMGTATTVREAVAVQDAGLDFVCVQGAEAGAHRGTFLDDPADAAVGLIALIPQVCDAVSIPVIAAGGIMDGRGLIAALALGADAVQMGTAFLRCPEAGTAEPYRKALAEASDTSTRLTDKITGRAARGIRNELMDALWDESVPPYPVMHALTAELRRAATAQHRPELMSLWAGQGVPLGTELPAGEFLSRVCDDASQVLNRLRAGQTTTMT